MVGLNEGWGVGTPPLVGPGLSFGGASPAGEKVTVGSAPSMEVGAGVASPVASEHNSTGEVKQ